LAVYQCNRQDVKWRKIDPLKGECSCLASTLGTDVEVAAYLQLK